ncbi:MAG: hypothetical protein LBK95_19635 [Bifidobacteriaceae bacterium]|jgi:hypothetical protein|nr:hypothetical protein [Bifidobacteriaceae bacterium]
MARQRKSGGFVGGFFRALTTVLPIGLVARGAWAFAAPRRRGTKQDQGERTGKSAPPQSSVDPSTTDGAPPQAYPTRRPAAGGAGTAASSTEGTQQAAGAGTGREDRP